MGDISPMPPFIFPTDAAEDRAKKGISDLQWTNSPVEFILLPTLWAQSHVGSVCETRIKQESE
jgi:hypothetical protein